MCGRYTLVSINLLHGRFRLTNTPVLVPRYNIAPTQPVAVVRLKKGQAAQGEQGRQDHQRELDHLYWGLIPSWAKDPSIGSRMINARSETIDTKPGFRKAFERRRCLIPADGFYEWKSGGSGPKQPYLFRMKDGQPFAFAGIWEQWQDPAGTGNEIDSCTILTTSPNKLCQKVHNRMPVILPPEKYDAWLDPTAEPMDLKDLLIPFRADRMEMHLVSRAVNNPRHDAPDCTEPVPDPQGQLFGH